MLNYCWSAVNNMATSLEKLENEYRSIICTQSAFIWWKDCENRSSISGNIWQNTPVFWPCCTWRSQMIWLPWQHPSRYWNKNFRSIIDTKGLFHGEKIVKIGPVYPEIFDKIRQFFWPCYTWRSQIIWLPWQRPSRYWYRSIIYTYIAFIWWKDLKNIRRYTTKYAKPREHTMQFPFVSLFSAETTGPIFSKILHVIVAFVMLLYFAYTRRYPIPLPNGIATK